MKIDKRGKLLDILAKSDKSISSNTLANMLDISERTIRNYIKSINDEGLAVIKSSRDGYLLDKTSGIKKDNLKSENEHRIWRVLSDLLVNKEGFNLFDEADSLYVSSSTILNSVLPEVKEIIKEYNLKIESSKYQYYLIGSEQNRRKMIGSIASKNHYGFFDTKDALDRLFPKQDINNIMQELYKVCQNSKLFLNDFALNNLLIHLLVILIRLNHGNSLEEKEELSFENLLNSSPNKEDIIDFANMIAKTFKYKYDIVIPQGDYKQILMLIALSVDHEMIDIESVISSTFVANIKEILDSISKRYCTTSFNEDFIRQFSLHMYYMFQRCTFNISYPNPITQQFKKDYAPVYDMAVSFSHQFAGIYNIEISEDEIAFIAFHIGSYLENNKQNKAKITCVVVAESYHTLCKQLVKELHDTYGEQIIVTEVIPLNIFLSRKPQCDLVLTMINFKVDHPHAVLISPILTKANHVSIREEIININFNKELSNAQLFLQSLLHEELYFRNMKVVDEIDCIKQIGQQCLKYAYIDDNFLKDVLQRESFSSTAFTDCLAIPHSITQNAKKSFICVVHNDNPIKWKNKTIHFVLMIGISENDMQYFKGAFDLIVEIFNSNQRTIELLKTNTFNEFKENMK